MDSSDSMYLPPSDDDPDVRESTPYVSPWKLTDEGLGRFRLSNTGREAVRAVTVSALGSGRLVAPVTPVLEGWTSIPLVVLGTDLARDSVLIVRWLAPSGEEFLWRATF